MRVLFVYPNLVPWAFHPQVGLCSLSATLREAGYETDLFDATGVPARDLVGSFQKKVGRFRPDIIALSIRSGEVDLCKELLASIPAESCFTVAGGHHTTVVPETIIGWVDALVRGEGEEALLDLVRHLEMNETLREVPNLWLNEGGRVYQNDVRPLKASLDELPMPHWGLFDERHFRSHFFKHQGLSSCASPEAVIGAFEGSRGCTFTCTYCSSPYWMKMYGGPSWRREKSVDRLVREINLFRDEFGLDFIFFVDEIFMTTLKRVDSLRDGMRAHVNTPFGFMERPELINEEKMSAIAEAGAHRVFIGVENGDQQFRRTVLDRRVKDERLFASFRLARKYGVKTHAFTMIGMPGETKDSIRRTFHILRGLKPDTFSVYAFYPLEGTKLREVCEEQDLIAGDVRPDTFYERSILNLPGLPAWKLELYRRLLFRFANRRGPLSWAMFYVSFYLVSCWHLALSLRGRLRSLTRRFTCHVTTRSVGEASLRPAPLRQINQQPLEAQVERAIVQAEAHSKE